METVACPDCDLLQRMPPLPPRGKARCSRCDYSLATRPSDPLELPLALTVAAAIAPASYLVFMLTVLLAVRRPPAPRWVGEMLRRPA